MMEIRGKEDLTKLKGFIALINEYLSNRISVLDFEQRYLEMFKQDETPWTGEEFAVLNDLFGDLDAFCYDPAIRDSEDLDEPQLRDRAGIALMQVEKLMRNI